MLKHLEEGKKYIVTVNGRDTVLLYSGPAGKKDHCPTCTCYDDKPLFTYISGPFLLGNIGIEDVVEYNE